MKAIVSGATGLIGKRLVARLGAPRVLVRDPERAHRELGSADALPWDATQAIPVGALDGVDVVFHLAGEPIAGARLTAARKKSIRDSRVLGTRSVVSAIRAARARPRVLVCASAIGFYGSRGDEVLTEDSAQGGDFLADICGEWEHEAEAASALGVRVVCARMGVVLAPEGGALASMRPAFRLGLGGPLGTGKQWMSMIHVDDVVGLLLHAAERDSVHGPLNVTAPRPERNLDFTDALGRAMHRPTWMHTPAFALRLALGDMADVVMASQRVLPTKAVASGYRFRFETIDEALRDIFSPAGALVEPEAAHS